ncbi:MAG: hypothetical protein KKD48_02035 [Nanoarchaeota archaeon]|nr:hypothetical protein [Nanoarchaeota archaeon]
MRRFLFLFLLIFIAACNTNTINFDNSKLLSENFVKNSETYKFDGISESLQYTGYDQLDCNNCYNFRYEYDSSQIGYGNRQEQLLAQIITHHTIIINIENGQVISAIVDNKWDEINQKEI